VLTHADEVWSSDITYVPMRNGFMYLSAVIDWFSRYVLSWRLSNTLDGRFCLEALDEALVISRPEIFNTDQGSQFTAQEYTGHLEQARIAVSRDRRGRALDNVFVERLWRSVKYEDIYSRTMSERRIWSRAWRPISGSTTRSVPINPWAIGLRGRSIEPGLAEAERGTAVTNPGQSMGLVRWVQQPGAQALGLPGGTGEPERPRPSVGHRV
jgi:transposase InsO family protein